MQQAVRDLNFPLSDVRVGNTAPADREVADTRDRSVQSCVSGHISGRREGVTRAAGIRQPASAGRQLGKTFYMPVQGREVTAEAARAVGKHPLRIPPSREWFALFTLCQLESDLAFRLVLASEHFDERTNAEGQQRTEKRETSNCREAISVSTHFWIECCTESEQTRPCAEDEQG